jgi:hypothetical protein
LILLIPLSEDIAIVSLLIEHGKKTYAIGYYKYKKGFSEFGLRTSLLEKAINSSRYLRLTQITGGWSGFFLTVLK